MTADQGAPLYKAVRPDGTSFYDPGFRWLRKDGKPYARPVTHPGEGGLGYLSVSTSPTNCTGMRWPCRLLTVEPVGALWAPNAHLPNKRAALAFRVTGEVEPHVALGPQCVEVAALIERALAITPDEARRLAAAWTAARTAAWTAARTAARDAAWDAAGAAAGDAAWDAAGAAAWAAAGDAAWAAAWAFVVRDLITPEQYDLLAGPWVSVMGA